MLLLATLYNTLTEQGWITVFNTSSKIAVSYPSSVLHLQITDTPLNVCTGTSLAEHQITTGLPSD